MEIRGLGAASGEGNFRIALHWKDIVPKEYNESELKRRRETKYVEPNITDLPIAEFESQRSVIRSLGRGTTRSITFIREEELP